MFCAGRGYFFLLCCGLLGCLSISVEPLAVSRANKNSVVYEELIRSSLPGWCSLGLCASN